MARPLRIEYAGAIYHVMSRGNARQAIFRDDADRQKLRDDLEDTVVRCGWELFAFVFMPNPFHLFFRTPRPNLSRGMQRLLSTYEISMPNDTDARAICFKGDSRAS